MEIQDLINLILNNGVCVAMLIYFIYKDNKHSTELERRLEKIELKLKVKAGDNGKIFGSVTSMDIANALKSQEKIELDKKKIELKNPIKEVGKTEVTVKLYTEISAKLKVVIEA